MTLTRLLTGSCLLLLVFRLPGQAPSYTLDAAVQYAYDNSLTVRNAQLQLIDAEAQIDERFADGLPQVNGSAGYQYFFKVPLLPLPDAFAASIPPGQEVPDGLAFQLRNNFTAGVGLNQMVFDGSFFVGVRAARTYRNFVEEDLEAKKQEARYQVIQAYLPALQVTETLTTLEKNLRTVNKLRTETQALYEAGFVEQLDVDRLSLTIANLETERDNLQQQMGVVKNALKLAMGYPVNEPIELEEDMASLTLANAEALLTEAVDYRRRAAYRVAAIGEDLGQLNIDQFRSRYLPSLFASASYQQQFQGNNFNDGFWAPTGVVGLNLNVPIFDGFRKRAQIDRAEVQLETNRNQRKDFERLIDFEVENARTNYRTATRRVGSQENNLALAQRIYDTTQIKYREGVGSSIELVQAEQSLFDSQANLIQAQLDQLNAAYGLRQALGL